MIEDHVSLPENARRELSRGKNSPGGHDPVGRLRPLLCVYMCPRSQLGCDTTIFEGL